MRIAVIGGGASGLACAIEAARAGAQVEILEAADRTGKKILATGNGRCNLSNADIFAEDYNRPAFVQEAMNTLPPEEVQLFFSEMGLLCYQEEEGRIYPYSGKAATVLDLLRLSASEAGAVERCRSRSGEGRLVGCSPGRWLHGALRCRSRVRRGQSPQGLAAV